MCCLVQCYLLNKLFIQYAQTPTLLNPMESLDMVISSMRDQVLAGNLTITLDNEVIRPAPDTFFVEPDYTVSCDRGYVQRDESCRKF